MKGTIQVDGHSVPIYLRFRRYGIPMRTEVYLELLDFQGNEKFTAAGLACCHVKDIPNKEDGRRVALQHCLSTVFPVFPGFHSDFTVETKHKILRQQIWEFYHSYRHKTYKTRKAS